MLATAALQNNLDLIEKLFNSTKDQTESSLYAKLGILELCGWTEEAMDGLIRDSAKRVALSNSDAGYLEKRVIEKTYGFHYDDHLREMLMAVIGLVGLERIEAAVDKLKFSAMTADLGALKKVRNQIAHTHLQGTTTTLDGLSLTKVRLSRIHAGLLNLETTLISGGF